MNTINALSMFSGGGIAETYFKSIGINVCVANELLAERADFYSYCHPDTEMICGDITDETIFETVMKKAEQNKIRFLIATPPCQGMSTLGKKDYENDKRNSLIKYVIKAIDRLCPDFILIENVPKFIKIRYNADGTTFNESVKGTESYDIVELIKKIYNSTYNVEMQVLNAMDYDVPQSRPRVIIKLYKKLYKWDWPQKGNHIITLREAIGDLPSLESGEKSDYKWHCALKHNERHIEALRHTPEGKSALINEYYYPKKADGTRVKGFHNTYNRMKWDEPAPARTTNSHMMSGHNNVHPGRLQADGTWSDARVLTLRELIIVSSLPLDWNIPDNFSEIKIREFIGEAIPPLMCKKICETILDN